MTRSKRMAIAICVVGTVLPGGIREARAQAEGTNLSVANNARAGAVRARRPGLMVQQALLRARTGPNITEIAPPEIDFRQIILVDLLQNLFTQLTAFFQLLPAFFDSSGAFAGPGVPGPTTGVIQADGDVIISELASDGTNTFVELFNFDTIAIDLTTWRFAQQGITSDAGALSGQVLQPSTSVVIQLGGVQDTAVADRLISFTLPPSASGELALYNFATSTADIDDFDDSRFLRDYLEWGNRDDMPPGEDVAVSAGLWRRIDFIPSGLSGNTFVLDPDRVRGILSDSGDYAVAEFAVHTLGTLERVEAPLDDGSLSGEADTTTNGAGG